MFDGYKVYGPYGKHRKIVVLVSPGHRTTMAYARYLMCLELGRELGPDEHVDHIDDDCTNDVISNLQVLSPKGNQEKDNERRGQNALVTLICPECKREFTRPRRYTNLRSNGSAAPSCCSRSCSAKYHNKLRAARGREVRSFPLGS